MGSAQKTVLLSFDLEEFDTPIEYRHQIPFREQISTSQAGTETVLALLQEFNIPATFFSTVTFASESLPLMDRICQQKHEIASHSCYHSRFEKSHLLESRLMLEDITGSNVTGFRMPRMQHVDLKAVSEAGYKYDSSLNPTYLPGRYNNFFQPRSLHRQETLWELPASVTPIVRLPLFWLAFHHLPLWTYRMATRAAFRPNQYVLLYFHPWEFVDLKGKYGLPSLITKNTGISLVRRFRALLNWMISNEFVFKTCENFIQGHISGQLARKT